VSAFIRHLLFHDVELVATGRGPRRIESFRRLPPEEAAFRRRMQACRQGGRGDQRRRLMAERQRQDTAVSHDADGNTSAPTVGTAQLEQLPADAYRPAGYKSATSTSASSFSSGGFTNDTEFGSISPSWSNDAFPELASVTSVFETHRPFSPTELLREPVVVGGGHYPLPPLPVLDAAVQTDAADVRDSAVDARPLPRPWLEVPQIASSALAERAAQLMFADPVASPRTLADRLFGLLPTPPSLGERRSIQLAVRFASDTMSHTADNLLNTIAAYFGHLYVVDPTAMLRVIAEHLDAWRRRPFAPEEGPVIDLCDDL